MPDFSGVIPKDRGCVNSAPDIQHSGISARLHATASEQSAVLPYLLGE